MEEDKTTTLPPNLAAYRAAQEEIRDLREVIQKAQEELRELKRRASRLQPMADAELKVLRMDIEEAAREKAAANVITGSGDIKAGAADSEGAD